MFDVFKFNLYAVLKSDYNISYMYFKINGISLYNFTSRNKYLLVYYIKYYLIKIEEYFSMLYDFNMFDKSKEFTFGTFVIC